MSKRDYPPEKSGYMQPRSQPPADYHPQQQANWGYAPPDGPPPPAYDDALKYPQMPAQPSGHGYGQQDSPYAMRSASFPNYQDTQSHSQMRPGPAGSSHGQGSYNTQFSSPYAQQGSPYAPQGSPYGQQESSYGQQGTSYGQQGPPYTQQASPYSQQQSPYAQQDSLKSPPPPQHSSRSASPGLVGQSGSPYAPSSDSSPGPDSRPASRGAGPSASSSSSSSNMLGKLKGFAPGEDPAKVLDPPPACFSRALPPQMLYGPFPVTSIMSASKNLPDGFPLAAPPSAMRPHPFATHDVTQEDWILFLQQIKAVSGMTGMNRIVSNVAPLAMGVGFLPGLLITRGLENGMKKKKRGPVSEVIAQWNHYFFHPRQIDLALAQGRICYTNADGVAPDVRGYRGSSSVGVCNDSDSDSSSSDDDRRMGRRGGRGGGGGLLGMVKAEIQNEFRNEMRNEREKSMRDARRQRKGIRRAEKRDRKDLKDEEKYAEKEHWRLVISHHPYMLA